MSTGLGKLNWGIHSARRSLHQNYRELEQNLAEVEGRAGTERMDPTGEDLAAAIAEILPAGSTRHPNGTVSGDVALPDLTPLLHARDAAEAKVASIGSVNPRPPGLSNFAAQRVKRLVARAWTGTCATRWSSTVE